MHLLGTNEAAAAQRCVAGMRRLLSKLDVPDEGQMYWWNRDSAYAEERLRAQFNFLPEAADVE